MIPPFKWIHEFMNTPEEWHAFVIGFGDGVAFTKTDWGTVFIFYKGEGMEKELHYYKFGLALGRFSILGFGTAMLKVIIKAVLA